VETGCGRIPRIKSSRDKSIFASEKKKYSDVKERTPTASVGRWRSRPTKKSVSSTKSESSFGHGAKHKFPFTLRALVLVQIPVWSLRMASPLSPLLLHNNLDIVHSIARIPFDNLWQFRHRRRTWILVLANGPRRMSSSPPGFFDRFLVLLSVATHNVLRPSVVYSRWTFWNLAVCKLSQSPFHLMTMKIVRASTG
jgi:hypothetical protein